MAFDRAAAKAAGYTDAEIDAYLQEQSTRSKDTLVAPAAPVSSPVPGFDRDAALAAGYTDAEIDAYLNSEMDRETETIPGSVATVAQQSLAGATTNKIKPLSDIERTKAEAVFVQPFKDVAQKQYLDPLVKRDPKLAYRLAGDAGLVMMGLPPAIAATKALGAVREAGKELSTSARSAQTVDNFGAVTKSADSILNDPDVPEDVKNKVRVEFSKFQDRMFRDVKALEAKGVPEDQRVQQALQKQAEQWKEFLNSEKIPKKYRPEIPKIKSPSALGGVVSAAAGPARAVGQRALKYGLGPAGAALTAKDIYDAVERGDYGDAAIQSLLTGVGFVPGIGTAASILGGIGYEGYKHLRDSKPDARRSVVQADADTARQIYGP